jgi:hypothetical protein
MHVLPLPFGLALALLPRRDARLLRSDPDRDEIRILRVTPRPSGRERLLGDVDASACRRPVA